MKILTFNAGASQRVRFLKELNDYAICEFYVQEKTGQYKKTFICLPCFVYKDGVVELLAQPPNHPIYTALVSANYTPLTRYELDIMPIGQQRTENNPFDFKMNIGVLTRSEPPPELKGFRLDLKDVTTSVLTWRRAIGDQIIS